MRRNTVGVVRSAVLLMFMALLMGQAGSVMWMRATTFPVPKDDKPLTLTGLDYNGRGGVVEITSVRLEIVSKKGADPVLALWTLVGRNATPKPRKVKVTVFLLNAAKKRIAVARRIGFIKPVEEHHVFDLKMKVKGKKWAQAHRVYVQVDFMVK